MLKVIQKKKCRKGANPKKDASFGVKMIKVFPIVSGITLFGGLSITSSAYAETNTPYQLTANIAEAGLSVNLSSNAGVLNLAPPYTGTSQDSTSVSVQVATHNGYQLFMVGDTKLSQSGENPATISTLGNTCDSGCDISSSNFTTNAWGYNVGARNATNESTSYKGLSTRATTLANQSLSTYAEIGSYAGNVTDTYQLNFAAKVDYTQAPGVYTGTINFIAVADPSSNRTYMQFMDASECTTTAQTVYDSRDNKSYTIKQLTDGKCWMLDNLALDPTADNGNGGTIMDNMTALNTNASAQSLAILKGGASAIEGLDNSNKKYASAGITNIWKENIITASGSPTKWTDHRLDSDWETKKDNYTDNWTVPRVNISNISKVQTQDWNNDNGGDYKIGIYYNYCSASAGTYCYDGPVYSASSSTQGVASTMTGSPDTDTSATEDICPAGWSMPTGSNSGEFRALYQAYGGSATGYENNVAFKTALSTPLSGYVSLSSGAVVDVGADGGWWSSTRYSSNTMYRLGMSASSVNPANDSSRSYGFSIRCVLR